MVDGPGRTKITHLEQIEAQLYFPDEYLSEPAQVEKWEYPFDVFVVVEVTQDKVLLARRRKPMEMLMFGERHNGTSNSGNALRYCKEIELELGRVWLPLTHVVGRYVLPSLGLPPRAFNDHNGSHTPAKVTKHLVKRPPGDVVVNQVLMNHDQMAPRPLWLNNAIPRRGWVLDHEVQP